MFFFETQPHTITKTITELDTFWDVIIPLFSSASSLFAFFALVISWKTLAKMNQQRKDSFRPRIIIRPLPEKIDYDNHEPYYSNRLQISTPKALLLNYGNEVAENIKSMSSISTSDTVEFLKKFDKEEEFTFEVKENSIDITHVNDPVGKGLKKPIGFLRQERDFLPSSMNTDEKPIISLPSETYILLNVAFYLGIKYNCLMKF